MYPLTIGLAIENRELWEQAQACLADLPFRIIVEHQDIGDVSNFLDRLERMRPDVVLMDISGWKEPLEGLVASIRAAIGDPMIIALNTTRRVRTRFWRRCAPASTNTCFRRCRSRCGGRWKSAPRNAAGGATAAPRAAARRSRSFPPRADAAPPR